MMIDRRLLASSLFALCAACSNQTKPPPLQVGQLLKLGEADLGGAIAVGNEDVSYARRLIDECQVGTRFDGPQIRVERVLVASGRETGFRSLKVDLPGTSRCEVRLLSDGNPNPADRIQLKKRMLGVFRYTDINIPISYQCSEGSGATSLLLRSDGRASVGESDGGCNEISHSTEPTPTR